ncbi:hypothetical protein [Halopseudomonas sp.]|uniref:hypothetical protein n=1 Tax=Halopseudomonas sp. TaxID=2901191 RepID=UPI00300207E8
MLLVLSVVLPFPALANSVSDAVETSGFNQCKGQLNQVAGDVITQRAHASQDAWSPVNPDQRLYSALIAQNHPNESTQSTITMVPNSDGGCDFVTTHTAVWDKSCAEARNTSLRQNKQVGVLADRTVVIESFIQGQIIFLTPVLNDRACMVTERDVSFSTR